ncbi:alpha,alpha-trehalose-phosphate synthase (UDP-forming) [Cribrihabitans pelagius]|uniref:alpha,alpha-trehalose-phosphate synthase (UDP-forming) n=1 Tax=Cribrihabitans pelagius TaxID=1765746 RepID=UPI003B5B2129
MGRLIIASNRTATPGAPRAGGLVVALWDALSERGGGVWFGWSGDTTERETRGIRLFAEENVDFALTDLTHEEYENYYLGYANRTLWPVFHYRVDLAEFEEETFHAYQAVNSRFGRLLAQTARPEDTIWVHDYQFLLLARELRYNDVRGPIGFFLHIPFPAPEVFTALPHHAQLAHGLAEYDMIGFQTARDTENFARYMAEFHDAELLGDGWMRVFGRTIRAAAFPIGIDPQEIERFLETEEARSSAERLGRVMDSRALVIGADRIDYSKGLPQRLQAFGRLLDEYAELRGNVALLQIAPPSREDVDAYQDLREELDRIAGRINSDYADLDWTPIRYIARNYPREVLAGLYRLARVALVTPLHDGMNLVAKEFVAAQDPEDPGVLILSEFAGAAEAMPEALLVNPHDVEGLAETISRALSMPLEERKQRWSALASGVTAQDVIWWRRSFLTALEEASAVKHRTIATSDGSGETAE